MHRRLNVKEKWYSRIWKFVNTSIFKLCLLASFLGILPLIIFIYYNLVQYSTERVLVGCVVLITLIKANKSIQG